MKTLEEQMSFYQAYHMNSMNKLTHFIGIPLIIYGIFVAMAWVELTIFGMTLNLAYLFFFVIWLYYLRLSVLFAILVLIPVSGLLYGASVTAMMDFNTSSVYFIVAFVGGWIIQLVGHIFEKRKPALVDNFFQIFIAPLFLVAELMFILGFKKEMEKEILEMAKQHMP